MLTYAKVGTHAFLHKNLIHVLRCRGWRSSGSAHLLQLIEGGQVVVDCRGDFDLLRLDLIIHLLRDAVTVGALRSLGALLLQEIVADLRRIRNRGSLVGLSLLSFPLAFRVAVLSVGILHK